MIACVVCCVVSVSAESMHDLKAGYLLGSTPIKQQCMQLVGIIPPAIAIPAIISLIVQAYGIGEPTEQYPEPLMAPQANLVADISEAIFFGKAPLRMIIVGAIMGAIIIAIDMVLLYTKFPFRLRVLSVSLGLYLPFENTLTVFTGAIFATVARKYMQKQYPDMPDYVKKNMRFGLMFAAGVITGESLTGIIFAIPIVISRNVYVMAALGSPVHIVWPGFLLLALSLFTNMVVVIYPALLRRHKKEEEAALISLRDQPDF